MHILSLTVAGTELTDYRHVFDAVKWVIDPILYIDMNPYKGADVIPKLREAAREDFIKQGGVPDATDAVVESFWCEGATVEVVCGDNTYQDGFAFANATALTTHPDGVEIYVNKFLSKHWDLHLLARNAFKQLGGDDSRMTSKDIEEYWSARYLQEIPNGPVDVEHRDRAAAIRAATQNPKHYNNYDREGRQWITNYLSKVSRYSHKDILMALADKYLDRLGGKDDALQEATKALWYYRYLLENYEEDTVFPAGIYEDMIWAVDTPKLREDMLNALLAANRLDRANYSGQPLRRAIFAGAIVFYLREGVLPTVDECAHEIGF